MHLLVSRFAFASWSDVGSQFQTPDHQDSGFVQPLVVRSTVLFPTSYVLLYALSKRDGFACLEWFDPSPGVARLNLLFSLCIFCYLLSWWVNILTTDDATLQVCFVDLELAVVLFDIGKKHDHLSNIGRRRGSILSTD
jgi:hypothetical protein